MIEIPLSDLGMVSVEVWATQIGVSLRAVQRWIADGRIPAAAVGAGNRITYLLRLCDVNGFTLPLRGRPVGPPKRPKKPRKGKGKK